ncbi:MAG TPA: multidrug effflux MFS transporter [Casimicrobiaceae bacterium]|nr:multidrug effflux MFS transporter [Casimicrobiaceae bacterium]
MTSESSTAPRVHRRSWGFAAMLASLSMLGPFAVDMYLPAFPAIGAELGVSAIALQQTLSVYMFAYAFMMLWHGALSDSIGRRPIVIGGLVVFALGTLGCAIAGNIESLWLSRVLQGLSAGSGLVVGRAIIRDRFHGAEAQRMMSQMTLVFGIGPALAPIAGGVLLNLLGWRSIFWAMLAWTLAMIAVCVQSLPETLAVAHRHRLRPGVLWSNYRAVLGRPAFALLALLPALNFCGFFLYISSAPAFLVGLLGVSTWGFAWLFMPMIFGIMIGAYLSGRLAGRLSPMLTIRIGYSLLALAAIANLLVCYLLPPFVAWNVLPIFVFTIGSSLIMPSVTLLLLDLFPTMRGMTSSLQGFVQFALGAVVAGSVSPLLAHSLTSLAWGMGAFAAVSFGLWLTYQRRAHDSLKEWSP